MAKKELERPADSPSQKGEGLELLGEAKRLGEIEEAYVKAVNNAGCQCSDHKAQAWSSERRRNEFQNIAANALVGAIGMEGATLVLRTRNIIVSIPVRKPQCEVTDCLSCGTETGETRRYDLGRWLVRVNFADTPVSVRVYPADGQKRIGIALHPHVYNSHAEGGGMAPENGICWGNLQVDADAAAHKRDIGLLFELISVILTHINVADPESARALREIGKELPKEEQENAGKLGRKKKEVNAFARAGG